VKKPDPSKWANEQFVSVKMGVKVSLKGPEKGQTSKKKNGDNLKNLFNNKVKDHDLEKLKNTLF